MTIQDPLLEPTAIDRELAFFLDRLGGKEPGFRDWVIRLHTHLRNGHVCLTLTDAEAEEVGVYALVDEPAAGTPLVLVANRLYLRRHFLYEGEIATAVQARLGSLPASTQVGQNLAVERVATARILVISGGPGTGKTTVVARLLEQVLSADASTRIRLAAPTGKAAARLSEALAEAATTLPPAIQMALPTQAETIHRLLRFRPGSILPRHGTKNKLSLDLLIIDEASMVDLALLAKTVRALPEGARLILLGDKDQLASVEAGAVLAELCTAAETLPDLGDHLIMLEKNYRFGTDSGIGQLALAIRSGDVDRALALLEDSTYPDATTGTETIEELTDTHLRALHEATSAAAAFRAFERFQILCPTRHGPNGLDTVNQRVADHLGVRPGTTWYAGRPVLIRRNAYPLRLYNGDVGIALEQEDGVIRVAFPDPDAEDGFRWLHPSRLPEHETVYAMTVHKSQGAQFDRVALLLPDAESRILTRELIYTAVTRARKSVSVFGDPASLKRAVESVTIRHSGLADQLGASPPPAKT